MFPSMSPNTLKQCDDQTLAALAAVGQVLQRATRPSSWDRWGVIVCPNRPGRKRLTEALTKYRAQGAWSTSPHLIPHSLLHSCSGLLSQAIGVHGPNMGVGGVAGAEENVLYAAAAWLAGGDAVGAWLVWTSWDHENTAEAVCEARVALVQQATGDGADFWNAWTQEASR
jgi:3-oxoacyl-(acyl-carrier-protein) synthase